MHHAKASMPANLVRVRDSNRMMSIKLNPNRRYFPVSFWLQEILIVDPATGESFVEQVQAYGGCCREVGHWIELYRLTNTTTGAVVSIRDTLEYQEPRSSAMSRVPGMSRCGSPRSGRMSW